MTSDAKFRWYEAINRDDGMPPAHRLILGYCAIRYAMESEGFLIRVTQQTIAENVSMTTKVVKAAFKSGRERGWVETVALRQRGRGHHGADTHRLRWPDEIGNRNDPSKREEIGNRNAPYLGEIGNRHADKKVTETPKIGNRTNAVTSENYTLKGINQGLVEGYVSPPPSCPRHPNGPEHGEPCRQCMRVREYIAEQAAAEQVRQAKEIKTLRLLKEECTMCDETGWIDLGSAVEHCDHGVTNLKDRRRG